MPPSCPADLAVVVVAYRSAASLDRCLLGLARTSGALEIVVVDNSGEDVARDVVHRAARRGQAVTYLDPGANLGFAGGCDLGVRSTSAPLVLLLNADVVLQRDLTPLLHLVAQRPDCAVSGGLSDAAGGLVNAKADCTLAVEVRRAVTGLPRRALPADGRIHPVDQVDGALVLLTREHWQRLGGLDRRYPLYYEDVDLCWRVRRGGGRVLVHAAPYGRHEGGASSVHNPTAYTSLRVSRLRYLRRRYGWVGTCAGVVLTAVEVATRAAGRTSEGAAARCATLLVCWREARTAMSQRPLR